MNTKEDLELLLSFPISEESPEFNYALFNPWDLLTCICDGYSSEQDRLMILTLQAVFDCKTFELIEEEGFIIEFMLYVLAGNDLVDYGTSPRGAWVNPDLFGLWLPLIEKWKEYATHIWGSDYATKQA